METKAQNIEARRYRPTLFLNIS